jgi:hypothetical protein
LLVYNDEKISFNLDEDTDCRRWRLFKNIQFKNGDEIRVVAESDGGEQVRLDFIEFPPVH